MKNFDFSNQHATIEKLQELGVLDRLKAMFRILKVAADRNEFTPYTRNTTKGSSVGGELVTVGSYLQDTKHSFKAI